MTKNVLGNNNKKKNPEKQTKNPYQSRESNPGL